LKTHTFACLFCHINMAKRKKVEKRILPHVWPIMMLCCGDMANANAAKSTFVNRFSLTAYHAVKRRNFPAKPVGNNDELACLAVEFHIRARNDRILQKGRHHRNIIFITRQKAQLSG
jgi:hypothetical protein